MARATEKRYRRKPRQTRRLRASESRHWLNAGVSGQESLFLDVSAPLFCVDSLLSRAISSSAHRYDGNEQRPFALFLPPIGQLGWQIYNLSKHYNVYLWSDPDVDQLEETVERFDAQLVTGDIEREVDRWIDLFICTEYNWSSEVDFVAMMREVVSLLSPEGNAITVLPASGESDALCITWADGSTTPLDDLLTGSLFTLPIPQLYGRRLFSVIDPHEPELISGFLKRNRGFFGRDARELLLARLRDHDILEWFDASRVPQQWVVLLQWQSQTSY